MKNATAKRSSKAKRKLRASSAGGAKKHSHRKTKKRSFPYEISHLTGQAVERVGEDMQQSGFAVVGKAIRRVGDVISHLAG